MTDFDMNRRSLMRAMPVATAAIGGLIASLGEANQPGAALAEAIGRDFGAKAGDYVSTMMAATNWSNADGEYARYSKD